MRPASIGCATAGLSTSPWLSAHVRSTNDAAPSAGGGVGSIARRVWVSRGAPTCAESARRARRSRRACVRPKRRAARSRVTSAPTSGWRWARMRWGAWRRASATRVTECCSAASESEGRSAADSVADHSSSGQPAGEGGDLADGGGGEAVGLGVGGGAEEAEEAREHLGHERRRQRRRGRPTTEDDVAAAAAQGGAGRPRRPPPRRRRRRRHRRPRRRRRRGGLRGMGSVLKVESANQRGEEAGSERRQRGGRGGECVEDVDHRVCDEWLAPSRRPQLKQRRRQPCLARGGRRRRGAQQRGERL